MTDALEEYLPLYLFAIQISSFMIYLFKWFALKKNGLFVFLLSSFGSSSFHTPDTVQYFLQPVTCLHFLNCVFQREDLNFDESNLSIFCCTGHDFDVIVKNSLCLTQSP